MLSANLILLPLIALLVGVAIELVLARVLSARGKGWLAFVSCIAALVGVTLIWSPILRGETLELQLTISITPAALAYHADGLSFLFALMAAAIGAAVLLYSIAYMAEDKGATRFYALMLVFIAGLIQLVYSADLLMLYASWEIIGLCSFLLVGFWYQNENAAAGARKVLVMTHLAGYGLLAAILLLYAQTGTTLWTDPRVASSFSTGIFLLMLVAALAKSVQFPLHTWIPDAMAAPTPVSALLHAACYVKAGVYLIARMHSFAPWAVEWQTTVIWIGTITMLVGVLFALVQSDLKRLLAFHTVSQIGYMVLGLGLGSPLGIAAALLHCLNHGLFKGGLFLCAGAVERSTGTRDLDRLGGLARRMPTTTGIWLILAGSIAGVPLLSGFVSKWLLFNAALDVGQIIPALVSWVVSILTVFSFLKATSSAFLGDTTPNAEHANEPARPMLLGAGLLAGGSIVLGIVPQLAITYLINPLLAAFRMEPVIGVSWLGLSVASGSWYATGGLLVMVIAVGLGGLVYWVTQPARKLIPAGATAGGVFTGGEPLPGSARLPASDFSLMVKQNLAPFYHWCEIDRYYLALWRGLLRVSEAVTAVSGWLERNAARALLPLTLALILVVLAAQHGLAAVLTFENVAETYGTWQILLGIGIALVALLFITTLWNETRRVLLLMLLTGVLTLAGLASDNAWLRIVVLEAASLLAVIIVWRTTDAPNAARVYLNAVLLSIATLVIAILTLNIAPPSLSIALVIASYALKLGLVPMYVWLPRVAKSVPAAVIGFLIAVVDVAAFAELLALRQAAPWIFDASEIWLGLGVLSALGGGLLMLAQRVDSAQGLKRLLAFSTIEDLGYLTIGVTLGGSLGIVGATIGIIVHALAKALMFSSVSVIERDEGAGIKPHGLAARYPLAGAGFLIGALTIMGLPPLAAYASRWRLYAVAAETNPLLLFVLLAASACAVLAYARVIAADWWGSGEAERPREPLALTIVVVGLCVLLLLLGLFPGILAG